jgi:hypothetical protein
VVEEGENDGEPPVGLEPKMADTMESIPQQAASN